MIKTMWTIIWRNLFKNKVTSIINILGLTIGIATAMFIGLYVVNEKQADSGLPHADRTFRLLRTSNINGQPYDIGITSPPFADAIKQDFSLDVEATTRVLDGRSLVGIGDKRFEENDYYYVDENFLAFFGFSLIHGDPVTALSNTRSVVISSQMAKRYFGSEAKAMGQALRIDNTYDAIVTGVLAKPKAPSHLQFEILESNKELAQANWWTRWWNNNLCTYIRLKAGASPQALEDHLPTFMDKYFGAAFERNNARIDLRLQPISNVYFESEVRYDPMRHGDQKAVSIFILAAFLLILCAIANFINLATAKATVRSKVIGVQRVLGSSRWQIVGHVLTESLILTLLSMMIAVQVVSLSMPWFESLFGVTLQWQLPTFQLTAALGGIVLVIALAAGLYPGWLLSSFKMVNSLKGSTTAGEKNSARFRKALVVIQFVLSAGLLCGTFLIHQQMDFLASKSLGFDQEEVLTMRITSPDLYNNREQLRQQLKQQAGVQSVAFMNGLPGGHHDATSVQLQDQEKSIRMRTAFVDFEFVKTLGLKLVAGRDFSPQLASDSTKSVLLNEQAVSDLGLSKEAVLGKKILLTSFDTMPRRVIGVVKNYHFTSLHNSIEPLVISTAFRGRNVAVKVKGRQIPQLISKADQLWKELSAGWPFNYQFMDEHLAHLYENEQRQKRLFTLFTIIAIFISCLGMFGLAAFSTASRTKEIGIRKVLGASVIGIVALLSKNFLKLVLLAMIITTPIVWYLMNRWLQDFAYRIDIQWEVFVLVGLIAIFISFFTIGWQSLKAALTDPVQSLRDE